MSYGDAIRPSRYCQREPNARVTTAATLGHLREEPRALEYEPDRKRPPRAFVLTRSRPMVGGTTGWRLGRSGAAAGDALGLARDAEVRTAGHSRRPPWSRGQTPTTLDRRIESHP